MCGWLVSWLFFLDRECVWGFCMEADFCIFPSCWATPDPITHSSIIWRAGVVLVTASWSKKACHYHRKAKFFLAASQCRTESHPSFPDFSNTEYLLKTMHKKSHQWFLEGLWTHWVSPTWMLESENSHPVFSHSRCSRAASIPNITNIKPEGCHRSCCLLPVGRSLILLTWNYLGKWKKATYSDIVECWLYLVSEPQQTGLLYTRKESEELMALASLYPWNSAPQAWIFGIPQKILIQNALGHQFENTHFLLQCTAMLLTFFQTLFLEECPAMSSLPGAECIRWEKMSFFRTGKDAGALQAAVDGAADGFLLGQYVSDVV